MGHGGVPRFPSSHLGIRQMHATSRLVLLLHWFFGGIRGGFGVSRLCEGSVEEFAPRVDAIDVGAAR